MGEPTKFNKIISKYQKKFKMNKKDFGKFLGTRVQLTSEQLNKVMEIFSKQVQQQPFPNQTLVYGLHLTSSIQNGIDIQFASRQQLKQNKKLKFLSEQQKRSKMQKIQHQQQQGQTNQQKKLDTKIQIQDDDDENQELPKQKIIKSQKNKLKQIKQDPQKNQAVPQQSKKEQIIQKQQKSQIQQQPSTKLSPLRQKPQLVEEKSDNIDPVTITEFDKTGQDFMNPIIKYHIVYQSNSIWRRYSQFQKLRAQLQRKYQGIALPQLPPKQGIKGGINNIWGSNIDTVFLTERKEKLQQWLNRILKCKFVCCDELLKRFITEDTFEVPGVNQSNSYLKTLSGYTDIVFNYSQLKDYGMAYYKYMTEYKTKTIQTPITQNYGDIEKIIGTIVEINNHRKLMNQNFNKRRQILYNYSEKVRPISKTTLDKILEQAEIECQQINRQYQKYIQLKMKQSWLIELLNQKKTTTGGGSIQEDYDITVQRITKMQKNLSQSFKQFQIDNKKILDKLGECLLQWRCEVHP